LRKGHRVVLGAVEALPGDRLVLRVHGSAPFGLAVISGNLRQESTMTSKVADCIRRGLEEALAHAEGTADASRYGVHIPEDIDVKAIRAKLGMTQEEFAGRFGFSINTLRHWEQGRRVPEGPTRAYLLVIDRNPKAVQKALRAEFRSEAHRQSLAVAASAHAREDQAFIDAVSDWGDEEAWRHLDRRRRQGLCGQAAPGRHRAG
jgi:putative transcriptional regulator